MSALLASRRWKRRREREPTSPGCRASSAGLMVRTGSLQRRVCKLSVPLLPQRASTIPISSRCRKTREGRPVVRDVSCRKSRTKVKASRFPGSGMVRCCRGAKQVEDIADYRKRPRVCRADRPDHQIAGVKAPLPEYRSRVRCIGPHGNACTRLPQREQ
jgi:hypothetical protein